jgi:molecular chaperone HscB
MNYFEFYQLPISFNIDTSDLKKKYLEISRKYHPDFYLNSTLAEQNKALEISSYNTIAFNTLNNFNSTIKYVLEILNMLTPDEKFQLPSAFLMEIMELNETIADVELNKHNAEAVLKCNAEIDALKKQLLNTVQFIFEKKNLTAYTQQELQLVKEYYFKNKYLARLKEQLN